MTTIRCPWLICSLTPKNVHHNRASNQKWDSEISQRPLLIALIHPLSDGVSHRLVLDKTLQVRQIDVVEHHGILLLRGRQSNKEFKVYVFRLSQLEASSEPLSRCDLKDHRMEKTRGAHLHSISRPGTWQHINFVFCFRKFSN